MLKNLQVQCVLACSQCYTTGLMIGSDYDQRLFGMFFVKFIGYFYGFVHIRYFIEYGSGIVRMASPVYLAAFYH